MQSNRRDGFTLLEVMISTVLLLAMILVVTNLSKSGSDAERYAGRLNRATELGQEVVDDMRRNLSSSVRVFHSDAIGAAYANLLELSPAAPRIASRLPQLRSGGIFEREPAGQLYTGNTLVFARHAWTDTYVVNSGRSYQLDAYRVCAYYLRTAGDGLVPGSATGLDFVRYVSEPLIDSKQVDGITDPADLRDALQLLDAGRTMFDLGAQPEAVHTRVEVAWRMGEDPAAAGTLRQIDRGSWILVDNPLPPRQPTWRLQRDAARSHDGLLYRRHHSVATNWSPGAYAVGQFSLVDNSGQGFPHGFEVQVIGPASARQILLRLAVISLNRAGNRGWSRTEVIQDCRDI